MLVYLAAYAGTVAAENALSGNVRRFDLSAVPRVTFSEPAVATVGLTDADARRCGIEPLVSTLQLEHVSRALAAHDTRRFVTVGELRGLRKLRSAAGKRFIAGVVLYDGGTTINFGGGLHAVPLRALWEAM